MQESVRSPLTHSEDVTLLKTLPVQETLDFYQEDQEMDVSRLFSGLKTISLYRCNTTGFEFFHPFSTAGDNAYYQELGRKHWYYDPDRWEHRETIKKLRNEHILEVGSGSGAFLKKVTEQTSCSIEGLELNSESVRELRSQGFAISETPVETFARDREAQFDVVCSFQVLEHVTAPGEFLRAQIRLLKPGGKLIIGVPNNDSYIGSNLHISRVLNEPPHHMGRWNPGSLKALEVIFPEIKLVKADLEPMISSNVDVYTWNLVHRMLFKSRFLTKVCYKLRLHIPVKLGVRLSKKRIPGQTILVTFVKEK